MSFTYAQVTHQFVNGDLTPASGSVELTLEQSLTNGGVTVVAGTSQVVPLDASGNLSCTLVSTQDPTTYSQGLAQWRSDERVAGSPARTVYLQVPSGGGSYDYGSLVQAPPDFG